MDTNQHPTPPTLLADLEADRVAAYTRADHLQYALNKLRAGPTMDSAFLVHITNTAGDPETLEWTDLTFAEAQERIEALREAGNNVHGMRELADRRSSLTLHQDLAAAFDHAADIEARIQAARRQQERTQDEAA